MSKISQLFSSESANTLFIISLTILIAVIADNLLRSLIKIPKSLENRRSRTYLSILRKAITIIVYVIAGNFILIELGINVTPFLASASIIGIIVGIGARTLIEDFINGFFLLTQDALAIGDSVKIDDTEGTIEKLGFRSLTLRGDGGELQIIPNGMVKKIINFSSERSNIFIDFPVRADQDIDLTLKLMNDALDKLRRDNELKEKIFEGSSVLGINDIKIEGRIIMRTKLTVSPASRFVLARKYRYLVKKNFEKNKIALI